MLHIEYQLLCSISFEHTYYQNGRSSDFILVPTKVCSEALERHGLILRKTADRTFIMQKMDGGVPETAFDTTVCLTFLVYLNNPLLWNVSQFSWEVNPNETVSVKQFYLTNLNEADGKLIPRLTKDTKLSEKDALPRVSPERFNVDVQKGRLNEIVIDQFLPEKKWTSLPPVEVREDQEIVEIRLNGPGLYRLPSAVAGASPPVFLANDEVAGSNPLFGVVDLFLDQTINPGTKYVTYIDNRKFGWRYVLVDVKNKKVPYGTVNDIKLSFTRHSGDAESPQRVEFAMLPEANLDEKLRKTIEQMRESNKDTIENVFVFGSDLPIPILENRPPEVKLSIKDNTNFAKLPVPDISTIHIRGDQSLIYFNI